ncbi:MAG: ABC transporter substrate-binding protein [Bdellovibrionales bacterium]
MRFTGSAGLFCVLILSCVLSCTKASKKEFTYCSEGEPTTFNPQLGGDGATFDASSQPIYNRLIDFEEGTTNLVPSLAKSWTVSKGGTEIVFDLQENVSFHKTPYFTPTRKFNAEDVVFSFLKMLDPSHKFHKTTLGTYEYFESMGMGSIIKEVKKISEYKVKFVLKKAESPFLASLAMDFASILSKEYALKLMTKSRVEDLNTAPVGTGPFVFDSYVKGKEIQYKRNTEYFKGASEVSNLKFMITMDPVKRLKYLREGKCDFVKNFASIARGEFSSSDNIKLVKAPGLNIGYIGINLRNKKLRNKKLRLAMNKALNRESYIDSIYLGNATQAKSPIPPGMWAYDEDLKNLDYDLEEAKRLIKESGVDLPLQLTLWTLPVSRPYNPNGKIMGEMIREDLKQIGIELSLVTYDWPTYLRKLKEGEHELAQYGWSADSGDPDNFLNILLSCSGAKGGSNVSGFCNAEYDSYINQAKQEFSQSKRAEMYKKALKIFQDEMPFLPIAHSNLFRVMSNDVEGYVVRPMGTESFYKVRLKSWK